MSSTLLARLWPGRACDGKSATPSGGTLLERDTPVVVGAPIDGGCWVGVGVDDDAVPLLEESVLPAARRYRPGEGFTGASDIESERSGTAVESEIGAGLASPTGFLVSTSSLIVKDGATSEALDEPEVETVESDDDDGCDGCPSRTAFTG